MKEFILKSIIMFVGIFGIFCGCFSIIFAGQLIYFIFDNKPLFDPGLHMILSILGCSIGLSLTTVIHDEIE